MIQGVGNGEKFERMRMCTPKIVECEGEELVTEDPVMARKASDK